METGFEYLWTRPEYSINVSPHPWSIGTVRKEQSQLSRNVPELLLTYPCKSIFFHFNALGDSQFDQNPELETIRDCV